MTTRSAGGPQNLNDRVAAIIGERTSPFHYRREGPEVIERMATLIEESVYWTQYSGGP